MKSRVHVQVEEFRQVLDSIDVIKSRLVVAKRLLHELHGIRAQENKELAIAKKRSDQMHDVLNDLHTEVFGE